MKIKHPAPQSFKLFGPQYLMSCVKYIKVPGIYFLFSAREGAIVPINRWLGIDKKGILYIGCAGDLAARIDQLKQCMISRSLTSHKAGRRFYDNPAIAKQHPIEILEVYVVPFNDFDTAENSENQELLRYRDKFEDLPPLNKTCKNIFKTNRPAKHSTDKLKRRKNSLPLTRTCNYRF